ncbi:MAG: response regulator [Pseudomonadota bacterium]
MHQPLEPVQVLLVDDEVEFTAAMGRALSWRGFEVRTACSGSTALDLLAEQAADVVVLDVRMPDPDGHAVFRCIRQRAPCTPVVFLSGHGTAQEAFDSMQQGAFDYLSKPCTVEQLTDVLRRACGLQVQSEADSPTAPIRLLLVDAANEHLQALSAAFENRGFVVDMAHTQRDAVRTIQHREFDVALVDIAAPGVDGVALLGVLRQHHPHAEILVLTGHHAIGRAYAAVHAGAYDFLLKPQGIEVLSHKVRRAYRRVQARRQQLGA